MVARGFGVLLPRAFCGWRAFAARGATVAGQSGRSGGAKRPERGLGAFDASSDDAPAEAEPAAPEPLTVAAFVKAARDTLRAAPGLVNVAVKGEISGFRAQGASGHWYFTLKDETAAVSCVMWRTRNARVRFTPEDGVAVVARGSIDVYEVRGSMQFSVTSMEPDGVGSLALAFEQLKRRLGAEGLFDDERKRALPILPRVVGVVTSREGAVWKDIQRVARRRFPGVALVLRAVRVQGDTAAQEVATAIELFNTHAAADVLIVGRGGGSLEDLWAFNEEATVRAIAASAIPVVSAVGHETDYTLADFTADLRAATPSQAAELVVPQRADLVAYLDQQKRRLRDGLTRGLEDAKARFDALANAAAFARPELWLNAPRQRVDDAVNAAGIAMRGVLHRDDKTLREDAARLDALSPLKVLARGYAAVTRDADGRLVRSADDLAADDAVTLRLADGSVRARVTGTAPHDEEPTEDET